MAINGDLEVDVNIDIFSHVSHILIYTCVHILCVYTKYTYIHYNTYKCGICVRAYIYAHKDIHTHTPPLHILYTYTIYVYVYTYILYVVGVCGCVCF